MFLRLELFGRYLELGSLGDEVASDDDLDPDDTPPAPEHSSFPAEVSADRSRDETGIGFRLDPWEDA